MQLTDFIGLVAIGVDRFQTDGDRLGVVSKELVRIVGDGLASAGCPLAVGTDWAENDDDYVEFNMCLEDKAGNTLRGNHDVRLSIVFNLADPNGWYVDAVVDDKDNGVDKSFGEIDHNRAEFAELDNSDIGIFVAKFLDVYKQKIKDSDPSRSVGVKFSEENWTAIETIKKHLVDARKDADYNKMRLYEDTDTGYLYLVPEVVVPADGEGGLDLSTFPCVGLVHGHFDSATEHLEVISID